MKRQKENKYKESKWQERGRRRNNVADDKNIIRIKLNRKKK